MRGWRRRISCGVAFFFLSMSASGADISIVLEQDSGEIEVVGLAAEILARDDVGTIVRVSVGVDAPAILGDYRIEGVTLRFRPMFPFDPGRDYVVKLDIGDEPIVAHVSLPASDVTPTTRVVEVYPTSEFLPENQLKLYVHFSAPMAGGDGLKFVRLVDESGVEVTDPFLPLGNAFWDRDHVRYTIFFDPGRVKRGILPNEQMGRPILDGKRYTLMIDPEWRDADGIPLAAPYEKTFTARAADETPIDPATWTITSPHAGTREPLVVEFHEALDRAVLERSLALQGIDGEVTIMASESRWVFTPDEPWQVGDYQLLVFSVLEDLAGNQIGKPFEVDVFERIETPDDVEDAHLIPVAIRE